MDLLVAPRQPCPFVFFVLMLSKLAQGFSQVQPASGVTKEMRSEANTRSGLGLAKKAVSAYEKIVKLETADLAKRMFPLIRATIFGNKYLQER